MNGAANRDGTVAIMTGSRSSFGTTRNPGTDILTLAWGSNPSLSAMNVKALGTAWLALEPFLTFQHVKGLSGRLLASDLRTAGSSRRRCTQPIKMSGLG